MTKEQVREWAIKQKDPETAIRALIKQGRNMPLTNMPTTAQLKDVMADLIVERIILVGEPDEQE